MSLVERKYNEALDRMSGMERLQISKEFPALRERELRKKVAERLYLSDAGLRSF